MKLKHLLVVAALTAILTPTAANATASASWRTVVTSADDSIGEGYGGMVDIEIGASVRNVRGLRLVSTVKGDPLKGTIYIKCTKGDAEATRDVKVALTTGVTVLPVPLPGGKCSVTGNPYSFGDGSATVRLQAR